MYQTKSAEAMTMRAPGGPGDLVEPVDQASIEIDEAIRQTVQVRAAPMAFGLANTSSAGSEGLGR